MAYTTRPSLLSRVRKGDELSWDEFYKMYKKHFTMLCYKKGVRKDDIEDVIQETITDIHQKNKVEKFNKEIARFRTFVAYSFKSSLTKYWRSFYKHNENVEELDEAAFIDNKMNDIDNHFDIMWKKYIQEQSLYEIKELITPNSYNVFIAYVIDELPVSEISKRYGMKEDAIYQNKNRIRKKLKPIMKKFIDE